jgi:hypothetical protein
MRKLVTLGGLAVVAVAACVAAERPTATHHDHGGGALLAQSVDMSRVDTEGLPDLIVEPKMTQNSWRVKDEFLGAGFCSVEEGNITPGDHRVLRFSVMTPNIGDADVFVGDPIAHMDPNGDGNFADQDGMFEFATCHNHFHFKNYATYRLIRDNGDGTETVWRSAKRGFCMLDTDPYNTGAGDGNWTYRSCGTTTLHGFQGVSKGWADTYRWFLAGQYFVLDGGDGQLDVPPGTYDIEIHVNPPYAPSKKGVCPLVKGTPDPVTGATRCFQFAESNYDNNIGRATVTIPNHPGREGYGPLKGTADPTPADETRKG